MNAQTKRQIVEALEQYLQMHGMSANEFAKKSTINESYISSMRKGVEEGVYFVNAGGGKKTEIADRYFEQIAREIDYSLEKTYWKTVPTPQLITQLEILEDSKKYGNLNAIIGETGCGKTFNSEVFSKKSPLDQYIIIVGSSDNIGDLIDKCLDAMRIPYARTKSKKIKEIISFLKKRKLSGFQPQVIFDESEYMKISALCAMKELYDNLRGIASIVLVGTPQLLDNLNKLRKNNKPGIPQFYRRLKFGIRTLPDIDRKFQQFLNGVSDKQLQKFIIKHCDNYGEVHDVLVPAMREADKTGQPLNEPFVRMLLDMPEQPKASF